eukprot:404597-Prymnesium_polylepis.3
MSPAHGGARFDPAVARCACAIDAAPTGASSKCSKSSSMRAPTDPSMIAETSASERGGTPSWSGRSAEMYSSSNMPAPMVETTWPSLT